MAGKPKAKTRARASSKVAAGQNWTLQVLVPGKATVDDVGAGAQSELHAKGLVGWIFGAEEPVQSSDVAGQWKETITGIVSMVGEWTATQSNKWQVEEVTFGLTLSAKGQLLFIAEASAQGSVQVKLKRAPR